MAVGTKDRPERVASNPAANAMKTPSAKTGAPDTDQDGKGKSKKSLKLKLAVVLVILLAGAAVAKFTVLAPAASKASAATTKPVAGPIVQGVARTWWLQHPR